MKFLWILLFCVFIGLAKVAGAVNLGVTVQNFSFTPNLTTVAPADTITWTRSAGTHNVHNTSTPTRFHNTISGVWTTYVWPCTASVGAYPYLCQVHATMTGTVNVARITITAANGGENWLLGSNQTISWTNSNLPGTANVAIEINRTFPGGTWETISAATANDGSHPWTVSGATGTTNRIRIRAVQTAAISGSISDESDADFSISSAGSITVVTPNGGEEFFVGGNLHINWTSSGVSLFNVELNRTFPAGTWEPLGQFAAPPVDTTAVGPTSMTCRIRVFDSSNPDVSDESDADFVIADPESPSELVIYPTSADSRLSWRPLLGVSSYNVYRAPQAAGPFTDLAGSTTDTFFVDPGIVGANSKYYFQVRAVYP